MLPSPSRAIEPSDPLEYIFRTFDRSEQFKIRAAPVEIRQKFRAVFATADRPMRVISFPRREESAWRRVGDGIDA